MKNVLDNPLFWKRRLECLIGSQLENVNRDWKKLYFITKKSLKHEHQIASAAKTGNIEAVKVLIKYTEYPKPMHQYNNIMSKAALSGNLEMVEYLLTLPETKSNFDKGRFMINACESGNLDLVKISLTLLGTEISAKSILASNRACKSGNLELVKYLLSLSNINRNYLDGLSIIEAAKSGNLELVDLILRYPGMKSDLKLAFVAAAEKGHMEILKYLILSEIDHSDIIILKALTKASKAGKLDILKYLLSLPNINSCDYINKALNKALSGASSKGRLKTVQYLLTLPKINPINNHVIMCCIENKHTKILELLLKDGRADPSKKSRISNGGDRKYGYPIIVASGICNFEITKLLLDDIRVDPSVGFNESDIDYFGRNITKVIRTNVPIMKASKNGNLENVRLLLSHPKVDPSDNDNLALRSALIHRKIDIVKLLLQDKRINPAGVNNDSIIRTSFSKSNGTINVIKLLLADSKIDPTTEGK
jgi:ankyrin repeat protein